MSDHSTDPEMDAALKADAAMLEGMGADAGMTLDDARLTAPADPTPPLTAATTPLPWHWDGLDLWHFGEGYDSPTDPHRFTGVVADPRLARSPILKMNMALIVEAVNAHAALTAQLAARTAERDALRAQLDEWDGVREHIRFLADSCEANSTVAAYENDGTPSPDIGGHMQRDRDVVRVVRQVLARTGSPRALAAPTEG